jgi:hypothetical protein
MLQVHLVLEIIVPCSAAVGTRAGSGCILMWQQQLRALCQAVLGPGYTAVVPNVFVVNCCRHFC